MDGEGRKGEHAGMDRIAMMGATRHASRECDCRMATQGRSREKPLGTKDVADTIVEGCRELGQRIIVLRNDRDRNDPGWCR